MTGPNLHPAPTKETAPAEGVDGGGEQEKDCAAHFDGHAPASQVDDGKAFATLAARAARAGCGLYALASGNYLLTRWQMVRELPDLRAVGQLLDAMGVRA